MAKVLEDLQAKGVPYRVGGEWPNPGLQPGGAPVIPTRASTPVISTRASAPSMSPILPPTPAPSIPGTTFGPVPPGPAQLAQPDYEGRTEYGRPETGPGGLPLQYVEPGRPSMPGPTEMFPDVPNIGFMEKLGNRLQQGYKDLSGQFANANSPGEALGMGVRAGTDSVGDAGAGLGAVVKKGVGESVAGFTGVPYVPGDKVAEEDSSNAPGDNTPGGNTPGIPKTGPYTTSGAPDGWTRTITQSATDPNREIAAYSDGKGSWMTGERDVGTGGGTFSVVRGPGSRGMSDAEWDALPNQEKINRNVAALREDRSAMQALNQARNPLPQRAPRQLGGARSNSGTWNTALEDYMSGRVGTKGYGMVRKFLGGSMTNADGSPNIAAIARMKQLTGLAAQEMESGTKNAGQGMSESDAAKLLMQQYDMTLKQQKAAQDQANSDRAYGLDEEQTKIKKAQYVDEFRQNFREQFHLPNAPTDRLAQDALRISQETNMSPYEVQQRMAQELGKQKGNGKNFEWGNEDKYNQFLINVGTQQ